MSVSPLASIYLSTLGPFDSVPSDWYIHWEAANMTSGQATRVVPDSSGGMRDSQSVNITVADTTIGTGKAMTASAVVPKYSTTSYLDGAFTFVGVWKSSNLTGTGASKVLSILGPTGTVLASLSESETNYSPILPIARSTTYVDILRWPSSTGNPNIRRNGTTSTRTSSTSPLSSIASFQIHFDFNHSIGEAGLFNRYLADDECIALEARIKEKYGL